MLLQLYQLPGKLFVAARPFGILVDQHAFMGAAQRLEQCGNTPRAVGRRQILQILQQAVGLHPLLRPGRRLGDTQLAVLVVELDRHDRRAVLTRRWLHRARLLAALSVLLVRRARLLVLSLLFRPRALPGLLRATLSVLPPCRVLLRRGVLPPGRIFAPGCARLPGRLPPGNVAPAASRCGALCLRLRAGCACAVRQSGFWCVLLCRRHAVFVHKNILSALVRAVRIK